MSLQFDAALFTPFTELENVLNMMGMVLLPSQKSSSILRSTLIIETGLSL